MCVCVSIHIHSLVSLYGKARLHGQRQQLIKFFLFIYLPVSTFERHRAANMCDNLIRIYIGIRVQFTIAVVTDIAILDFGRISVFLGGKIGYISCRALSKELPAN